MSIGPRDSVDPSCKNYMKNTELINNDEELRNKSFHNNIHNNAGTDLGDVYPCHPAPPLPIKLFIGKLPSTYLEEDLKLLFAPFGNVQSVAIIRDKLTLVHKGAAFVRMCCLAQADHAIERLHCHRILHESLGPMHVKYALGECDRIGISEITPENVANQAKLYVGNLPKEMTEDEIKNYFMPYGQIDAVYIMKDTVTGIGKGCAFVKYIHREQALYAIKCLDKKHTFPGCTWEIEVRFAEKCLRRPPQITPINLPQSSYLGVSPAASVVGYPTILSVQSNQIQSISSPVQTGINAIDGSTSGITYNIPRQFGTWKEYFNDEGRPYYHDEATSTTQWEKPANFEEQTLFVPNNDVPIVCNTMDDNTCVQPLIGPSPSVYVNAAVTQSPATNSVPLGDGGVSQEIGVGPCGSNIFVFHVPIEWTQKELLAAFCPFGKVVSARIATDKEANNKAKGYAFVSYDSVQSAASAVNHMNGFVWGGKKLKVSIKKGEEYAVQHLLTSPHLNSDAFNFVASTQHILHNLQNQPSSINTGQNSFAIDNNGVQDQQLYNVDSTNQYCYTLPNVQQPGALQYSTYEGTAGKGGYAHY